MLTPELVRARVSQGQLHLTQWSNKTKERAEVLANEYLALANGSVGATREELRQQWALVPVSPAERRLADGLMKLIEDAADFGNEVEVSPLELRRDVFLEASTRRRAAELDRPFDRDAALAAIADRYQMSTAEVEEALYADLKGAQRLKGVAPLSQEALLERYEVSQLQAVLLRAVDVVAEVRFRSPLDYRQLFNKLKFRRLLYRIERLEEAYRIHLDGPFSLFESVTKYGMQLALVLPALLECDELKLEASLRWGKQRKPVQFKFSHKRPKAVTGAREASVLTEDVVRLKEALESKSGGWQVSVCTDVLDLPGVGLCVPDLAFSKGKRRVYLEVLGYWSREAVWRRIEMVDRGLPAPVVFAVSSRLRVSEDVLDDTDHAALYVYKGSMSPAQILKRVEAIGPAR